ncbi:MAG: 6-phospho-3-hexuloisomerase [Methanosarcinales archaeon]|nr:MAG: 6-phospho-3-hexuloisomerase [Methanosarcinales archaeon]
MSKDENKATRNVRLAMKLIGKHITKTADSIQDASVCEMIDQILRANKIFVMGAGRSGLVGRAFAMRLMHLDLSVFVVGETVTPAIEQGDVLVIISGSGETKSIVELARVGKQCGAKLISIISNTSSSLAKISDVAIEVKGRTKIDKIDYLERQVRGEYYSLAPLGTLFETTSMVFLDGVISGLMSITKKDETYLRLRHTSLE